MKCKVCGGTGTSNTCVNGTFKPCSFCDGTGECDVNEVDRFNAVDFIKVMEMVKKPQTNEEWFCSLPTEEKAKWMAKHMSFCEVCEIQTCRGDGCQRFDRGSMTEMDAFREWLKQPHATIKE